jgi:RNA polymerase sigma-70 factor (ECF subfamily)
MALNKFQDTKLRDQEKNIFINAYDQYIDQIYRFVYFKVGDKEEAQDLTSAIFLKAWDYIQQNKVRPKTLKALIYKIARNTVIDHYRGKSAAQVMANSLDSNLKVFDEKQDLQKHIELKFDLVIIEKKLMELKDEYREVIILRFTEEFSISEIADILGKTRGNTRVLIYRALKALREVINQ